MTQNARRTRGHAKSRRALAGLVVPAAGLGTRLRPLTDAAPKEMLPLGGRPAIAGALLEAAAAGLSEVVVVVSPGKYALRSWIESNAPPGTRVRFALQPEPVGVLDAVERGRALLAPGPFAVLHPDWIHLPDQRGLCQLVAAWEGGSVIGLVERTPDRAARLGPTARADTEGDGPVRRVVRLDASTGPIHTAFAEIRGADHPALLRDDQNLDAWNRVAAAGRLRGVLVSDDLLDVGTPAGYEDAAARFADGRTTWR